MAHTTYFITGANRGLGRGLTEAFVARPATTVVAAVRDPAAASSQSLLSLPVAAGSRIVVVKLPPDEDEIAAAAVKEAEALHGITSLDVVVANAAISNYFETVDKIDARVLREFFQINTVAQVLLYQATLPLLKAASHPKFISMSTAASSIGDMEKVAISNDCYGASKAALNYLTKKMHLESEWLTAMAMSPGWAQTDMGNDGAKLLGLEQAPLTLEECVEGMLRVIDGATRATHGGKFVSIDDEEWSW